MTISSQNFLLQVLLLDKIHNLNLSSNQLRHLPKELFELPELEYLFFENNPIEAVNRQQIKRWTGK